MTDDIQKEADKVVPADFGDKDDSTKPLMGVHVVLLEDGSFGMQVTGSPSLGEVDMLLARAYDSVRARMVAETVAQVQAETPQSRIITPSLEPK